MRDQVTAIIVNWNGAGHLPECLDSLARQTYTPLELMVVDNASTDESEHVVRAHGVRWLPMQSNVGLAAAFNEGARVAKGSLLLFLNNDMRFAPDFVEKMVDCLKRNPNCVAVDAVQRDWEDREVVHAVTRLADGRWRDGLRGWRFELVEPSADALTAWPSGANTLIAAENLRSLGGWDERFFAGYEDVDLGWRIWRNNREVRLAADAICWHKVGASSGLGEGARVRAAAAVHGPLLFALKSAPSSKVGLVFARELLAVLVSLLRVDRAALRLRSEQLQLIASQAPSVLRWRRAIQRESGQTTKAHWRRMRLITGS